MSNRTTGPHLYRRPGYGYFYVVWQDADGKPQRLSTGTRDRGQAERIQARVILSGAAPGAALTVAEILRAYIDERGPTLAAGKDRLRYPCERIIEFFGAASIGDLTRTKIAAYQAHRREAGISDGTIHNELTALKAALNHARKDGRIDTVPHIDLPRRPGPRERWLTRDEAHALIGACVTPHIKLFIEIALNTGARSGAILDLTWGQVDLERRLIEFNLPGRRQTAKRRAAVPINDRLLGIMKSARRLAVAAADKKTNVKTLAVIVFRGKGVRSIKKAFARAAARAGLGDVTPHTLRHTAATWMAQAGVDLWAVGGVLGHASPQTTARYAKHHPDYLRRAVSGLWPATGQSGKAARGKQRLPVVGGGTPTKPKTRRNVGV